jgi:hypothetical protein
LRHAMTKVLGNSLPVKVLASELALLRYGLFFWKKERANPGNIISFTTYKEVGYIGIWCILFLAVVVEMGAFHLLLLRWSNTAAIIITALTAYGLILFVADLSAVLKRNIVINGNSIVLRTGLRWRAITSLDNISSAEKISNDYYSETEYLKGGIIKSSGNLLINFKHPVKVEKLYGKDKETTTILLNIDNVKAFIEHYNAYREI